MNDPQSIFIMKILQVVIMIGIFGGTPWLTARLLRYSGKTVYGLVKSPCFADYLLTFLLFIVLVPFLQWTIFINEQMTLPEWLSSLESWMRMMEDRITQQTEVFMKMSGISDLMVNLIVIAIIPAFFEELYFRGFLQSFLTEWIRKPALAILLTSLFFSAIHLQFYGFLPRLILGLVLGYLFFYSGSIWLAVFFHFVNNAISVGLTFLEQKKFLSSKFEENMVSTSVFVIASLAVSAAVLIYLAFYYDKKRDKSKDWIKIFETMDSNEAQITAGKLENSGIHAAVINKKDSSFTTFGMIEIYVSPQMEAEAKKILNEDVSISQTE